jgi:hypothetical protein
MRSQSRGVQIIPTDPIRTSPTGIRGTHPSRRTLEFILILETRWWEIGNRTPRWRIEGVAKREGVRARGLGKTGIGKRILARVSPRVGIFPIILCLLARCSILIAFFVEARDELLDDCCFEEGSEIFDAGLGDEDLFEFAGEVVAVFDACGCEGDAQRERGGGDVVFSYDFETGDALVAEAEAADLGFAAESVDFDDVLEGGLGVRVEEGVGAVGVVPSGRETWGDGCELGL